MRTHIIALVAFALYLVVGAATAAPREVMVLKLEGRVLDADKRLRTKLTKAVIDGSKRDGVKITKGGTTLTEVVALLGCPLGDPECRVQLLASLLVDEIVACAVSKRMKDGALVARVSHLTPDGKVTHTTIDLVGNDDNARAATLQRETARVLAGGSTASVPPASLPPPPSNIRPPPPVVDDENPFAPAAPKPPPPLPPPPVAVVDRPPTVEKPPPPPPPAPKPARQVERPPDPVAAAGGATTNTNPEGKNWFSLGAVERRSWIVMGAGAGAMVLGVGALAFANSKQREIDRAPIQTPEDLEHIVDLERDGRWRYRITNALLFGGLATVATGVVLGVIDMRRARRRSFAIAPMAVDDGAGLAIEIGGP